MSDDFDFKAEEKFNQDISDLFCKQLDHWVEYIKKNYIITSLHWNEDDCGQHVVHLEFMEK